MLEATDRSSPEIQLGERLRRARELAGFAQGEAAQALGITSAALSQYEGGKRRIEALTLDRIARLYGVSITYFLRTHRPTNRLIGKWHYDRWQTACLRLEKPGLPS